MKRNRDTVIAWCSAVTAATGTLATWLTIGKAPSHPAVFAALIVITAAALVFLLATALHSVVIAMLSVTRNARQRFVQGAMPRDSKRRRTWLVPGGVLGGLAAIILLFGFVFLFDHSTGNRSPRIGSSISHNASPVRRAHSAHAVRAIGHHKVSPPTFPEANLHDPGTTQVNGVTFSPNGYVVTNDCQGGCTANSYSKIALWDSSTRKIIASFIEPYFFVSDPVFSPNGIILAVSRCESAYCHYGEITLWDRVTHSTLATLTEPYGDSTNTLAFAPNGKILAAGDCVNDCASSDISLWDVATHAITAHLADPNGGGVYALAFSPDGKLLASDDENGETYIWDLATRRVMATVADPDGGNGIESIQFSPNGRLLAISDDCGETILWDRVTSKVTATLTSASGISNGEAMVFSPDGKSLAISDGGRVTFIWDLLTRTIVATLTDPRSQGVNAVAFSQDGKTLAVGDLNGHTYLWSMNWLR